MVHGSGGNVEVEYSMEVERHEMEKKDQLMHFYLKHVMVILC